MSPALGPASHGPRVDGRVLNFLTVEDLFQLKVTNQLHHLSIKRGIQVLLPGSDPCRCCASTTSSRAC